MEIRLHRTPLFAVALSILALAMLSIGGHASGATLTALADDELTSVEATRSPGLYFGADGLGGIRFIYSGISEHSFRDAKGIITVIQVPGDCNNVYVPVTVNIFVYLVQVQFGGTVIVSLPIDDLHLK